MHLPRWRRGQIFNLLNNTIFVGVILLVVYSLDPIPSTAKFLLECRMTKTGRESLRSEVETGHKLSLVLFSSIHSLQRAAITRILERIGILLHFKESGVFKDNSSH